MTDSSGLDKQRDIAFGDDATDQIERAYQLLCGLPELKVAYSDSPNALRVSYNLHRYTLEALESILVDQGFSLNHSMLHNIERNVIYYSEDTLCHNMDIPIQPTKMSEREVFVKAYEQEPHGDHDDTPPELRDYK